MRLLRVGCVSLLLAVKDLGFYFHVVGTVIVVDRIALYPLRD